jgi:mono/diheme cytochrome c family protein
MTNADLTKAYDSVKTDIANLLGWFECELDKQPANLNWAHVGSLSKIRTDLVETLSFMSGIKEDIIKDGLAESWAEAQTKQEGTQSCES